MNIYTHIKYIIYICFTLLTFYFFFLMSDYWLLIFLYFLAFNRNWFQDYVCLIKEMHWKCSFNSSIQIFININKALLSVYSIFGRTNFSCQSCHSHQFVLVKGTVQSFILIKAKKNQVSVNSWIIHWIKLFLWPHAW